MTIVKLKAGLGNTMFQYALGRLLEKQYGIHDVAFDSFYIENYRKKHELSSIDGLNTCCRYIKREEYPLLSQRLHPNTFPYRVSVFFDSHAHKDYYLEQGMEYVELSKIIRYHYLDGYWQSYKYVEPIRELLMDEFCPKKPLSEKTSGFIDSISHENAVMVGIRLGNYENSGKYYVAGNNFLENAMKKMASMVSNPIFIVFTNRVQECMERYTFPYPVIFREKDDYVDDYEELQIMRSCKHAIIASSTFHWWGAWLIDNPGKIVIHSDKWFINGWKIDINPPEWISLT